MGGNYLVTLKRLFRESLFRYRSQQQRDNLDGRPNSPLVPADYDMSPTSVFIGHVHGAKTFFLFAWEACWVIQNRRE